MGMIWTVGMVLRESLGTRLRRLVNLGSRIVTLRAQALWTAVQVRPAREGGGEGHGLS